MSETKSIEERYKDIVNRVELAGPYGESAPLRKRMMCLLDDLMAERGKNVNLDEIFPKEVMERAKLFGIASLGCDCEAESTLEGALWSHLSDCVNNLEIPGEVYIEAYSGDTYGPDDDDGQEGYLKPLASVRARLGLTVEIVEDK